MIIRKHQANNVPSFLLIIWAHLFFLKGQQFENLIMASFLLEIIGFTFLPVLPKVNGSKLPKMKKVDSLHVPAMKFVG